MPVLVTGGETGLGRAAARALLRRGGEVRVYLDAEVVSHDDVEAFRRRGCKVAVGTIDDEGRLELALEQVHTVVHCWGGPLTDPNEELDGVAGALSAALGARCRRFVWASHLGADEPAGDAYLEACAEVEALLAEATIETIAVRRALTYGRDDRLTHALAAGAGAGVRPLARHAPVLADDVGAAIAQADAMDRDAARRELSLTLSLAGPQVVTFGEMAAGLAGVLPHAGTGTLPQTTVALYSRDLVGDQDTLGRDGTPLQTGLGRLIGP